MVNEREVYHDRPVTVRLKEIRREGLMYYEVSVMVGSVMIRSWQFLDNKLTEARKAYEGLLSEINEG